MQICTAHAFNAKRIAGYYTIQFYGKDFDQMEDTTVFFYNIDNTIISDNRLETQSLTIMNENVSGMKY